MNILINKTYLFFFTTVLLIVISTLYKPKETFDVNIGDTYYIIQKYHLGILLSFIYFSLGTIYWLLNKKGILLSNWVIYLHTIVSIGGLILIWILFKKRNYSLQTFEEIIKSVNEVKYFTYTCTVTIISMILIQIVFIVNIVFKIWKN